MCAPSVARATMDAKFRFVFSHSNGFFLTLCGSFAVSDGVAMGGHANEIGMVAGPGVRILGVALTVDDGWVVAAAGSAIGNCPIVVGVAEVGMAGPTVTSRIYQSRASR